MKQRCLDPNSTNFPDYGGRGVKIYEPWHAFEPFREWIVANIGRPRAGLSLDRIKTDGNYEPGNVRWATRTQQNRNKRNTIMLTHPTTNDTLSLAEWADRLGLKLMTLYQRVARGMPLEAALTPGRKHRWSRQPRP
jgi:hypothetical protein